MPTPGAILVTTKPPDGSFNFARLAVIAAPDAVVNATQLLLERLVERKVGVILLFSQSAHPAVKVMDTKSTPMTLRHPVIYNQPTARAFHRSHLVSPTRKT
jgi:hypothetical protein